MTHGSHGGKGGLPFATDVFSPCALFCSQSGRINLIAGGLSLVIAHCHSPHLGLGHRCIGARNSGEALHALYRWCAGAVTDKLNVLFHVCLLVQRVPPKWETKAQPEDADTMSIETPMIIVVELIDEFAEKRVWAGVWRSDR